MMSSPQPMRALFPHLGERTYVMGILNVTPDSFSDGGDYVSLAAALQHAHEMVRAGVDIIDVGGESTRPGAPSISVEEECSRVLPVLDALMGEIDVPFSIDTAKAEVAQAALARGVQMVNDVTALSDPNMATVVKDSGAYVVLMHMRGTPRTMQVDPVYQDVVGSVKGYLAERAEMAIQAGIPQEHIFVDPGIGFGKTLAHNVALLQGLSTIRALGFPVLVGTSRKSFIGAVLDLPVMDRLEGSLASVGYAMMQGADVVRVHDVAATCRFVKMMDRLGKGVCM